ncbi:MAG: TolC family protein [Candidatus Binatia bacterium]|nr:TolC family protein [Candidatus Binatia bacterium]
MEYRTVASTLLLLLACPGCLLLPAGFEQQRQRSEQAAARDREYLPERPLPSLDAKTDLETLTEYAWRANGEIRAALLDWVAAVERVRDQSGYPNTNLHLALQAMWANGDPDWNDVTWSLGNDPMTNLALPFKVAEAGRVALAEARRAEAEFHARRLALREQVAERFFAWVSARERARLAREKAQWLARAEESAAALFAAGLESQADWLATRTARIEAENEAENLSAEVEESRRRLNALLGRPADAILGPPAPNTFAAEPPAAVRNFTQALNLPNPELAGLRAEVARREHALAFARLQFFPDINPMIAITGDVSRAVGAGFVLPLTWRKLQAQVAAAEALVAASRAQLQQGERNRESEVAAALVVFQNAERQRRLWSEVLLPQWRLRCDTLRRGYEAGREPLGAWVDAEVARLEGETVLVELLALREQQAVRLQNLLGQDPEWLRLTEAEASDVAR